MVKDRFPDSQSATGSATSGFPVTPSDTEDLPEVTRALYVGTAGSLRVRFLEGTELTYAKLGAGRHQLRVVRVFATGTTADHISGEV